VFETDNDTSDDRLPQFRSQLRLFEQLRGQSFIPTFFGAYAARLDRGLLGIIVSSREDKSSWNSYDAMNDNQR
jgi:hypothetical protein